MRIAINGMGRIGRLLFRRLIGDPGIEVVAVNDLMDKENLVYLLKHDSIYGNAPFDIAFDGRIKCCGKEVEVLSQPDPSLLPWRALQVDIVLECSGKFITGERAALHLGAGARKVLLSTTGASDIPLLIYGFNQHQLHAGIDIISPGGCMTNCSMHLIYLLNSIGIESLQLNVIHSYTSRQELVDAPHKDFRRGRAAAESVIPVEVDLAVSLERLWPVMKNRIAAVTTRVPVANGALGDFTFQLKEGRSRNEINAIFQKAAAGEYKGIIAYSEEPLVSLDVKSNPHSAIIDGTLTSVVEKQVKVFAFFDNEYGYTSRMIDWIRAWKPMINGSTQ